MKEEDTRDEVVVEEKKKGLSTAVMLAVIAILGVILFIQVINLWNNGPIGSPSVSENVTENSTADCMCNDSYIDTTGNGTVTTCRQTVCTG